MSQDGQLQQASQGYVELTDPRARNRTGAAEETPSGGVRGYFAKLLPDRHSRLAFALALLLAIAAAGYWLAFTIQYKWQAAIADPAQVVRFEAFPSLPVLFGFILTHNTNVPGAGSTHPLYRRVIPRFAYGDRSSIATSDYINCNETHVGSDLAFCQPLDADRQPIFQPRPGELDGSSAFSLNLTLLSPLQFRQVTDMFCMTSYLFVNQTERADFFDDAPVLSAMPLSAQQTLAMTELLAANRTSSLEELPQMSLPEPYLYNYQNLIQFTAKKTIRIDGSTEMDYTFLGGRTLPMSRRLQAGSFQVLLNWTTDSAEQATLQRLWNDSTAMFYMLDICYSPASFQVQVVREVITYGWSNFLADVGGFLNLLSLAMALLFPLAYKATEPRSFVVLWLAEKLRARKAEPSAKAWHGKNGSSLNSAASSAPLL